MTRETEKNSFAPDVLDVMAAVNPAMSWMNAPWIDTMTEVGGELASFVADRFRQDIALQQALLRCRSLAEAQHKQAEFLQKAFDQYQAETGKLIAMTGGIASGRSS
ncbi:phasin family protein [Yoonia vestfoldensis]|uniref:phasin family protein n=1 Tax=Yoonia vestfoldensis TaxID=245188 RepID=UPI0003655ABD|nr:phasin family protein [Yoonia vestfoldensis]